jgi:hypothetical protein
MRRGFIPAAGLFFLAPLVSEFLLGNLPITMLGALVVLAPMYGGGALLIRESVRRAGRGWPSIFVLALAFGIAEEAFMTQSLFNPNYLGLNLHLLNSVYIPALGIGGWWTVFVLTLHTVWSISVSIALVEAFMADRAAAPSLGRLGLVLVGLVFTLASVTITSFSIKQDGDHFVASTPQFTISAILCVLLIAIAFRLPAPAHRPAAGVAPNPWWFGLAALLAGSVFLVIPRWWGWWAIAAYLALDTVMIAIVYSWRTCLDSRHRLALAAGAAIAYAWHAFIQTPSAGAAGTMLRIGNVVFAVGAMIVIAAAGRTIGHYRASVRASETVTR